MVQQHLKQNRNLLKTPKKETQALKLHLKRKKRPEKTPSAIGDTSIKVLSLKIIGK